MGLRRHRQIAVWSSSPGRPGALGFTWAPRSARIRWCFRTGGLLAVIGLLRVAAAILPRWRLLLAGVVLTTVGLVLRNSPASVVMLPGMLLLAAAAFTQTWPEEAAPVAARWNASSPRTPPRPSAAISKRPLTGIRTALPASCATSSQARR